MIMRMLNSPSINQIKFLYLTFSFTFVLEQGPGGHLSIILSNVKLNHHLIVYKHWEIGGNQLVIFSSIISHNFPTSSEILWVSCRKQRSVFHCSANKKIAFWFKVFFRPLALREIKDKVISIKRLEQSFHVFSHSWLVWCEWPELRARPPLACLHALCLPMSSICVRALFHACS